MVVSSDRSLSAQRAATAVYGNYAGSVVSSSRPNSLPPSQAGSFHYPAQPLATVSRNNSFHYTVNSEAPSTASSLRGSVQFTSGTSGHASSVKYARVLQRPASFAGSETQAPSAPLAAPRIMSLDEASSLRLGSVSLDPVSARSNQPINSAMSTVSAASSRQEKKKTSPEVLAMLQGIKQQLKGMADRYTDNTDNARGIADSKR